VLVNDLEVWTGVAFGVIAFVIYLRQFRRPFGRNRVLTLMTLATVSWLTIGYAVLGLNVLADETVFGALWMRPAGITLLAIVAALGIGERRNP
jgi:hypothetical protein